MECTNTDGCTLDSAEMIERANAWRALSSRAISREVHAERIVSIYPLDPELLDRLQHLIAAEAICCSFLKFSLEERNDQIVVEVGFPPDARSLVETVISSDGQEAKQVPSV